MTRRREKRLTWRIFLIFPALKEGAPPPPFQEVLRTGCRDRDGAPEGTDRRIEGDWSKEKVKCLIWLTGTSYSNGTRERRPGAIDSNHSRLSRHTKLDTTSRRQTESLPTVRIVLIAVQGSPNPSLLSIPQNGSASSDTGKPIAICQNVRARRCLRQRTGIEFRISLIEMDSKWKEELAFWEGKGLGLGCRPDWSFFTRTGL